MQGFAALSMLILGAITLILGVRLGALAWRTRLAPETCFAGAFLSGSLGSALAQIGQRLIWTEPGQLATIMNTGCFILLTGGTVLLFVAMWKIYGNGRPSRLAVAATGSGLAVIACVVRIADGEFLEPGIADTRGMALYLATRFGVFLWAGSLSLSYHAQLRRRLALGLADPVATGQIWLWGVAGMLMAGVSGVIGLCVFGLHEHPLDLFWSTATISLLVLTGASAMWCAFFPPVALRRRWQEAAPRSA